MVLPFKKVELEQGSDAWLQWRHKGIGASDASTIMGENRFECASRLLVQKRGPLGPNYVNEAMARGTQYEPQARREYEVRTGSKVRPICIQSIKFEWMRASLDGLSEQDDSAVEIKCGNSSYKKTSSSRQVPDCYYGQLQHILTITEFERIDFWCWLPGMPGILLSIPRNENYIERLIRTEQKFWDKVCSA